MLKNKAGYIYFYAEDTNSGLLKTGATITVKISKDGGTATASTNSVAEVETGVYKLLLTAAETNADVIAFLPSTATAYTKVYPAFIETQNVSKELPEELTSDHQTANTIGKAIADTNTKSTDIQTKVTDVQTRVTDTQTKTTDIQTKVNTINTTTGDTKTIALDVQTKVTEIQIEADDISTELSKVVVKLPSGTISDFSFNTQLEGLAFGTITSMLLAMANGNFTIDTTSGNITFYRQNNTTPIVVMHVTQTSRTRVALPS